MFFSETSFSFRVVVFRRNYVGIIVIFLGSWSYIYIYIYIYRVSWEECARLRENVP